MTKLEVHYPEFPGLNLTWETLEGTVKHNGPIKKISNSYLKEYNKLFDLDLKNFPSLEGQVGAVADDIAYNNHDIDDGFNAGFFSINELRELPFINDILVNFEKNNPGCTDKRLLIYAITRNMIARMIFDVLENTKNNLKQYKINTENDARIQKELMVDFSDKMKSEIKLLRQFLKRNFYTHTSVARMDMKSQKIIEELFAVFMSDYNLLPMELRNQITPNTKDEIAAEIICEYIAGMTDMAAVEEHKKLFDVHTRF